MSSRRRRGRGRVFHTDKQFATALRHGVPELPASWCDFLGERQAQGFVIVDDPRPWFGLSERRLSAVHAAEAASDQDRAWSDAHPEVPAFVRPGVPGELGPGTFSRFVLVTVLIPGVRVRQVAEIVQTEDERSN